MPSHKRADPSETSSEDKQEEKKDKKKAVEKEADEADKKLNDNDAEFTIQLDDDEDEAATAADGEKEEEAKDGAGEKSTKTEKTDDAKPSFSPPPPEEKEEEEKVEDEAEIDRTEDVKKAEEGEPERTEVTEEEKGGKKEEEAAKAPASRESSTTPVPEEPATGEVVEEVPLSVKEQIAAFSQLRLQETHGKPKPGVASAFAPKPATPPPPISAQKAAPPPPPPPVEEARPVAQKAAPPQPAVRPQSNQLFENPQPKPFYAAVEKPVEKPVEKLVEKPAVSAEVARVEPVAWNATETTKVTDFGMEDSPFPGFQQQQQPPWFNGERKPSYEQPRPRPQPQQQQLRQEKPQQHTSSTKWTPTVAKAEAPAPPASKLAAFGTVYKEPQLMQASEQRQQAPPKKYIGPEIVSSSTGPSQLVRLRRQNSEINWGFAVFGGTDFGCPPFISRVSLLSIAGKAGLEVGDIIVSICDTPVQGKQHTDIKAEILRAGNELDFMIIKQGIDKRVLSEKVPEVLQPAASMEPQPWQSVQRETRVSTDVYRTTTNRQQQQQYPSSRASSTGSSPYRPIRTNSLRLLDEYIANRSMRPKNEPTIRVYTTPTYQMEPSSKTDYTSDYYTTSTVVRSNRNVSSSLSPTLQTVTFTPQPAYQQQQQPLSYGRPGALSPRPYFASPAHSTHTVKYVSAEPSPRGGTVYTGIPYDSLTSQVYYSNNNTVRTQPLRVTTMSNSYQPQPQRQQQQQQQQQYTYKQTSGQVYSRPTYYSSYDPEPERWSTTGTTTETTTTNSAWL